MSCQVEQIADCGDISTIARALFIPEHDDENWLSQCCVSLSSCGSLLAVGRGKRLCILTSQWISATESNTFLISWSGTMPSEVTALLALSICPSQQSSQSGPDWFCIVVGFKNGSVDFYTSSGHQLLHEKLEEKPVMKVSCHTGTYGTMPDDIHVLYSNCVCIIVGANLFQTLRNAKAQLARGITDSPLCRACLADEETASHIMLDCRELAVYRTAHLNSPSSLPDILGDIKVQAGIQADYSVDSRNITVRKWTFTDQEVNDAAVVGLELKTSYDHLLAASMYGGYDTWYRSVPPMHTLVVCAGRPFVGFTYAVEGGAAPPLGDVARAVANRIKSALPFRGWLGSEPSAPAPEPQIRGESLSPRAALKDARWGQSATLAPDRRLAAISDDKGRVAVLDVHRGHLIRMVKGCRDAQCGFVQLFDVDHKKPQLSVIKEIKRAVFLIIYNPRKGLIDIRLMQRGTRVAVFTATKNGQLLYNTCGLVGAEKNYTHKKLNLPEFQCVLIDPDGKLKKFNIPFFYALEGENSDRSKDLHTLRELREFIKKSDSTLTEEFAREVVSRAETIKTLELKKHCLEMFYRKYDIPPKTIMMYLEMCWDSIAEMQLNDQDEQIRHYFANLALVTLFYRHINNDNTDDMQELVGKVYRSLGIQEVSEPTEPTEETDTPEQTNPRFSLLEDDNCILERLLHLAQQNGYSAHGHHPRVTFLDNTASKYKEFISCFTLNQQSKHITLKPDTNQEKLNNLSADIFKLIFGIEDLKKLTSFLRESNIEPKDIVKLLIMHLMNMALDEISVELIEKLVAVLYYLCGGTAAATDTGYNEMSPWWQAVRDQLVGMPCPLRSMLVAMACKAVGKYFETNLEGDDSWVSVTKENAKWGILIGKLEDISLLSIILMFKDTFKGEAFPKLEVGDVNINLQYIYTRGKGSVTELIAKWLTGMGVPPAAVVANELMETYTSTDPEEADDSAEYMFLQNNRAPVDENPTIFKWLSLLRRQFPLSTSADYIIANVCWEYAVAWQKQVNKIEHLNAVVGCLKLISNLHLRLGLFSIIWSTYIKEVFESACRLVNKVGRLPKDPLCLQNVGLGNAGLVTFLDITTGYLEDFLECANTSTEQEKQGIQYEKIWEESIPSLVEVAQDTKRVNTDILTLNYQISCTIYYQCHYNMKFSKPLDLLYDIDYQYIFDALTGNVVPREISLKASEKLRSPRMKFVTRLVRAAAEAVTADPTAVVPGRAARLAQLWGLEEDFVNRQQVIALFHLGHDTSAANVADSSSSPSELLAPLIALAGQRLKQSLAHSPAQAEWLATVPPHLYRRLQATPLDPSIPADPSLASTMLVLNKVLYLMEKKSEETPEDVQNVKLAQLIVETCDVLLKKKL